MNEGKSSEILGYVTHANESPKIKDLKLTKKCEKTKKSRIGKKRSVSLTEIDNYFIMKDMDQKKHRSEFKKSKDSKLGKFLTQNKKAVGKKYKKKQGKSKTFLSGNRSQYFKSQRPNSFSIFSKRTSLNSIN